jgi:hypothetical protein
MRNITLTNVSKGILNEDAMDIAVQVSVEQNIVVKIYIIGVS